MFLHSLSSFFDKHCICRHKCYLILSIGYLLCKLSIYLPYGKFDITSLSVGFDMIFACFFSCEAHIESARTYRAQSAYRSPQANIDA